MNLETLAEEYITVPGIASDLGIPLLAAHNLVRGHTFPKAETLWNRLFFKRTDYRQFKAENPDLIQKLQARHAKKVATA